MEDSRRKSWIGNPGYDTDPSFLVLGIRRRVDGRIDVMKSKARMARWLAMSSKAQQGEDRGEEVKRWTRRSTAYGINREPPPSPSSDWTKVSTEKSCNNNSSDAATRGNLQDSWNS
jgi:hypothetical protein